MNVRMQKHGMMRWLGRLFVVVCLVTSWNAQAAVDSVPPTISNWSCAIWDQKYPNYSSSFEEAAQRILNYVCNFPSYQGCILVSTTLESQPRGSTFLGEIRFVPVYRNGLHAPQSGCSIGGHVTCPVPTVNPTVPYEYNTNTNMCERSSLTITLSGGDQIEPSKGSTINNLPFTATVIDKTTDQPPTTPVKVSISLKVDAKSGGHDHGDSTRPRGWIESAKCESNAECWSGMTDSSGKVVFNFKSPEAAGKHTITATCDGCTNNPQTKDVNVKVEGLLPIPDSVFYRPITPNADTNHPQTHFLKPEASAKLIKIARQYYAATYRRTNGYIPNVMLNDASLEWGGILDCFLTCPNSEEWKPSHKEHRKGSVIDIRARIPPADTSMPNTLLFEVEFMDAAKANQSDIHGSGNGRHFHLKLLGIGE